MNVQKFTIFVLCTLLGLIISLQVKSVKGDYLYVPLSDISDLRRSIKAEELEITQLKEEIENIKDKVQQYQEIRTSGGKIRESMIGELGELMLVSGSVDVDGPGIVVVLNDGTRELYEGENPNNVIIHDGDVLNILNDLKVAGAEAISINGQRVMSFSEISCAGYTIRINGLVFGQPFIFRAIGDAKTLEAAIIAPGTYGDFLKEIGLFIEVSTASNLSIKKYSEDFNIKNLQVVDEEKVY